MDLPSANIGDIFDLVGKVLVFDIGHSSHLLQVRGGDLKFNYEGLLTGEFHSFTLFNVRLSKQFPVPVVSATKDTMVLGHQVPTWDSLHSVIDLCSGFGGLAQGSTGAGFEVVTAVDQNEHMVSLHAKASEAVGICGDFGSQSVLMDIWKVSRGAAVISSGFSCQPFSRLGDGRGELDTRANCLTKTLNAAIALHAYAVILESVAPAAQDQFVKAELLRFCRSTGFTCSQTELRLDHVWPCRRQRAWWILTAPEIGEIKLSPWKPLDNLWETQQIIPEIRLWDQNDEQQLSLDHQELEAFGVTNNTHAKHMLNAKGVAPCALHAWGSQLHACPCGCRKYGFSACRLESKGLHGCLVRSALWPDGNTYLRHLHPNETMALNCMDPVLDFGENVKLTLSAAGQMACPIQALWVFSHLAARLDDMQQRPCLTPDFQIQAYRSWMLLRCRQVWPSHDEVIRDDKLLSLIGFWKDYSDLSLAELVYPMRWEGKITGSVSIASVLDFLIRTKETIPETLSDVSQHEDEPTPWMDCPIISDDPTTVGCMQADSCTVVIEGTSDSPIRFQPKCCATVSQFLNAHAKLVETLDVEAITLNGSIIPLEHVMEVGQVIVIRTRKLHGSQEEMQVVHDVSPTVEWSQPVQDPIEAFSPPRKVLKTSKFDVGECGVPPSGLLPDQPWLDATPFLQLQGEQFLKLSPPMLANTQQLWSVRHQFFRTNDRLQILEAQQQFWADDEIRFHLNALIPAFRDYQLQGKSPVVPLCVIDPLITTSWVSGKGFDCSFWAKDHPEIFQAGIPIITVVLIDKHWVPVHMTPIQQVLHVSTWDKADAVHEGLNHVIHTLAVSLGFESALIRREHRLFFTSELCGSLAIAFLRHALVGTLLPTDSHEAEAIHAMLRTRYVSALQRSDIVDRPWIWGAGDAQESTPQSSVVEIPTVNITRDQRIDLINERGTAMADDEMRFHLINLVEKQPVTNSLLGRSFTFLEPLVFNCGSSIGKIIVEQWCARNAEVHTQGVNVVTAFAVEGHWIPVWFSPRSTVMQVHMLQAEGIDFTQLEEVFELITHKLGFETFVLHKVPDGLPPHTMCGAFTMCFLAHVVMGMPLPDDLAELRTLHTNMRASFVAQLYAVDVTPRPVVWGTGRKGTWVSSLPCSPVAEQPDSFASSSAETQVRRGRQPLPPGRVSDRQTLAHDPPTASSSGSLSHGNFSQVFGNQHQAQCNQPVVAPRVDVSVPFPQSVRCPSNVGFQVLSSSVSCHLPDASGHTDICSQPGESGPLPIMPVEQHEEIASLSALSRNVQISHPGLGVSSMPGAPVSLPVSTHCPNHDHDVQAKGGQIDDALSPVSTHSRESGPLPIMPDEHALHPAESPRHGDDSDEMSAQRQARLLQVTSHSYAMADDEMHFQLQHLMQCHVPDGVRSFTFAPPLYVFQWMLGDPTGLDEWIHESWKVRDADMTHLMVAFLIESHWIPVWFSPCPAGLQVHTLAAFASDEPLVDSVLHLFAAKLGMPLHVIHRVPHGLEVDRLCGVMTLSFFAHIMMRTAMPRAVEELHTRCWKMKEVFARALQSGPFTQPTAWGWGCSWECRPLPRMPAWCDVLALIEDAFDIQHSVGRLNALQCMPLMPQVPYGMSFEEMSVHVATLACCAPVLSSCAVAVGRSQLEAKISDFLQSPCEVFCCALLLEHHWMPVLAYKDGSGAYVFLEKDRLLSQFHGCHTVFIPATDFPFCGAATWAVLARVWMVSEILGDLRELRSLLFLLAPEQVSPSTMVGFGPHGHLFKNLCAELSKHGIPEHMIEERAHAAIKVLGSEQLLAALNHRQPWRQLKALGNNSKFQFVLPSELAKAIETQKGRPVAKGKGKGKAKPIPTPVDLDPAKLQVLEGTFRFQDRVLPQLTTQQIGPLSSGVILMSHQDAEPYLKSGKLVSQEPLALIVLHRADKPVQTMLPHALISVPCRCMIDSEPVLIDAVLVQVGTGLVEKTVGTSLLTVDTPDVVTLKVLVYKDELHGDWPDFCQSPIKCLVGMLPMLKRCFTENCSCEGWHNPEKLPIRDPIIDVWRRQYLRQGFKPCPPAEAEFFSVCLRIPMCLLEVMLGASGVSGVYCEPRTADGKEVLPSYTVIWTPKHSLQEMRHIMQTNPAVIGLARLADRRGLRVRSAQAKTIHELVRPDTVYLPSGPKGHYTVGPFPYGVDRQAVGRILHKAGWECRPLQPAAPCPGKGVMWTVQSAEEPSQTILMTTSGEIMISKVKQDAVSPSAPSLTVGSAATLALCGRPAEGNASDDPWAIHDPWKRYHPASTAVTGPSEGLQQIEDRIQTAVLAKIQPPMEQDDLPDRVMTLEGQVQHLLAKQQGLETQFQEHSSHHSQQITALQGQVSAQAQQLHGHLENQNQTMQSLFEQQMQQIRGLLAKRPREEGME